MNLVVWYSQRKTKGAIQYAQDQQKRLRDIVPHHFLLVPGVGAQGGSLEEVCKYGMTDDCGLLVNSSRAIIFASQDDHFAEIAGNKARELQQQMDVLLKSRNL